MHLKVQSKELQELSTAWGSRGKDHTLFLEQGKVLQQHLGPGCVESNPTAERANVRERGAGADGPCSLVLTAGLPVQQWHARPWLFELYLNNRKDNQVQNHLGASRKRLSHQLMLRRTLGTGRDRQHPSPEDTQGYHKAVQRGAGKFFL